MRVIVVKCENKTCDSFNTPVTFDSSDFKWDVKCSSGDKPGDMFYELPESIHCQKCFYMCSVVIVDID